MSESQMDCDFTPTQLLLQKQDIDNGSSDKRYTETSDQYHATAQQLANMPQHQETMANIKMNYMYHPIS